MITLYTLRVFIQRKLWTCQTQIIMKKIFIVLFWSATVLYSCGINTTAESDNPKIKEIENFIVDYYEVMSSRNWSAYQLFFSEKATLSTIWQESVDTDIKIFTNSISEFVAQTANGPDSQPIFEEKPLSIDVEINNNLASVWVKYEAKFGSEKELIEWKGYDLFSLLNFNDKWYVTSITYVSNESE